MALVSVGYQLRLDELRGSARELSAGLLFKLLLGPRAAGRSVRPRLARRGTVMQVTLFEAAMGLGGAIVAMDHGLNRASCRS